MVQLFLVYRFHNGVLPYRYLTASSDGNTFFPPHPPCFPDFASLDLSGTSGYLLLTDSLPKPSLSIRLDFIQWRNELWDIGHQEDVVS